MNAAEMLQHGPQQMGVLGCPGVDLGHRKFHCVSKDSGAR
jgi:hypothetical protein